MGRVQGRVALVTGGARGMGAAHATILAKEGARVVICDVLDREGSALADRIGAAYLHLDVTDEGNWAAVVERVDSDLGHIEILANNAGIVAFTPTASTSLDQWSRVLNVNLTGVFLGIRTVVPSMRAAGGGVIVNTSSVAGLVGMVNLGAYVASKWGVRGLTKAAALDLAADGIRVVSIHPGVIDTPMIAGRDVTHQAMTHAQPIPRAGKPEEVARLLMYLVSDATYSTGVEFVIDGGHSIL